MKSNTIPYAEVQLLLDWTEFSKHLSSLKLFYQTICYSDKTTRLGHRRLRFMSVLKFWRLFLLDSSLICIPILPDFTDFKRETHVKNTCENAWYIFKYYINIKAHLWPLLYTICHLRWSDVDIKCTLSLNWLGYKYYFIVLYPCLSNPCLKSAKLFAYLSG